MARPTVCIVDTNALKYNFEQIKKQVQGRKVLVPVKADAYGHGLCQVAHALKDFADYFGVATLEEGKELRESGIETPVLCLDPLPEFPVRPPEKARALHLPALLLLLVACYAHLLAQGYSPFLYAQF